MKTVKLPKCKASNFKEFSYVYEANEDPSKVTKIFCLACKDSMHTKNTNSKN